MSCSLCRVSFIAITETVTVAAKSNARAYQIAITVGDRLRITQFFFHTNGLDYDYIVCPKYSRKLIQFD